MQGDEVALKLTVFAEPDRETREGDLHPATDEDAGHELCDA
jgi:hypothetical protein